MDSQVKGLRSSKSEGGCGDKSRKLAEETACIHLPSVRSLRGRRRQEESLRHAPAQSSPEVRWRPLRASAGPGRRVAFSLQTGLRHRLRLLQRHVGHGLAEVPARKKTLSFQYKRPPAASHRTKLCFPAPGPPTSRRGLGPETT